MDKAALYKCSKTLDNLEEQLFEEGFEHISEDIYENGDIIIYKKEINYTQSGKIDKKVKFLAHKLLYAENIYIIFFKVDNDLYWIRRGGGKCFIDKYKNINYPLYYFANVDDYENYSFIERREKSFDLFTGEKDLTINHEREENLQSYFQNLNMYNNLIERFKIRVPKDSTVGVDINLQEEMILNFTNGIDIVFSTETKEDFSEILNTINNIRNRNGTGTIRKFFKLKNKAKEFNFNGIDDLSGLFIVENRNALSNLEPLTEEYIDDDGFCKKNIIGFFNSEGKNYYINFSGNIYNIKVADFELSNQVSSNNPILKAMQVESYSNENDYIDQISNVENKEELIHVFHKNHYKKNSRSKFEICDVFYWDKTTGKTYLIFIKYGYTMKSSEVFWQSSFVYKQFETSQINTDNLDELFDKVNFPRDKRKIELFQNAYYVNLILPERGNVNTENLSHIINLWKNDSMGTKMQVIVPETVDFNGKTRINFL